MKKTTSFFALLFFLLASSLSARVVEFASRDLDPSTIELSVHYSLEPKEWLYADSLALSLDHPAFKILSHKISKEPTQRYDPSFKKSKKIFENSVTLYIQVIRTQDTADKAYLHVTTYSNLDGSVETLVPVVFKPLPTQSKNNSIPTRPAPQSTSPRTAAPLPITQTKTPKTTSFSPAAYISDLVKTINSPLMRLLLVFLLGVLLSLTPCIYPMVPITIGILQSQGGKSLLYNFFLALAYTCGIATTFALFGLLASCTGPLCGQLLMQPIFIIGLVIILSYLALSMLGLYDVYVPKFFKSTGTFKGGSLLSSFIFGTASGTIASPCVSPGLVLLLSIVATLNNKLLGFLLLFVFGIGLSTPLLLVGAFSSSLNLLPRAGLWMLEIKKLFGFMIFGMCFYYISYIIPLTILIWFIALFVLGIGIFYLYTSYSMPNITIWKKINYWLGMLFIAGSLVIFFQAYRLATYAQEETHSNAWHTSYEHALQEARNENKKIFIDFWATFCPVCLAINKTVLTRAATLSTLENNFVLLKVDGSHNSNIPYSTLKTKFPIKGFPTFLIVEPHNETVIAEMGGEIYDMPEEEFIAKIKTF